MLSRTVSVGQKSANAGSAVLLVSADSLLILDLQRILGSLGLRVEAVQGGDMALAAIGSLEDSAVILLDVELASQANGRLLAAIDESGVHKRCAIALIADQVSDEWIARLREGVIDDIVPRNADAAAWNTHLNTMKRGHALFCELELLRAASLMEAQHDRVTGVFNRETMLTLLFRETDRVQRLRGALCLVLFDIDNFGHWNSELGREIADGLLREVAQRAGRNLRSYDLLGRTGSDEILLALPGCSSINAVMLAERLRVDIFGQPFVVNDRHKEVLQLRLTACFGITSSRGRSPVVVLREAEETLQLAKQSGPDAIRCASESPLAAEASLGLAKLFPEAGVLA